LSPEVALPRPWGYVRDRKIGAEVMDRSDLDPVLREQALQGLERLRRIWLRPGPLLEAIDQNLSSPNGVTLRLVELGSGTGTLCAWIGRELERRGRRVEMVATDKLEGPGVRAFDCAGQGDWMDADLFFSNLMLHHLDENEIRRSMTSQFQHSRFGAVHMDLERSRVSYYLTRLFLPVLGYSRINQSDGLLSIQAAFRARELEEVARGNSRNAKVRSIFPFRQILTMRKEESRSPGR
jgi:hypothetical protein